MLWIQFHQSVESMGFKDLYKKQIKNKTKTHSNNPATKTLKVFWEDEEWIAKSYPSPPPPDAPGPSLMCVLCPSSSCLPSTSLVHPGSP